ncbi:MAG: hypothetical protein M3276_08600 [Actinomycetota bacterium]|nr:hypothetical protein [Actinomycetota bacterium]
MAPGSSPRTAVLDEVRRRRQQQTHGHRGHKDDPLFRLRPVLRVGQERLDDATVGKIFERTATVAIDEVTSTVHSGGLITGRPS